MTKYIIKTPSGFHGHKYSTMTEAILDAVKLYSDFVVIPYKSNER